MKRTSFILALLVGFFAISVAPAQAKSQTIQLQSPQQSSLQAQNSKTSSSSTSTGSSNGAGEALQPASSGKTYAQATRGLTVVGDTQAQTQSQGASQWVTLAAAVVGLMSFAAIIYVVKVRRHKHAKNNYHLPQERPVEDKEIEEVFNLEEVAKIKIKKGKKTSKAAASKAKNPKKAKSKKRH